MFILTELTPNPEALKFIPHSRLTDGASWSFERAGFRAERSPLAARLFGLDGVRRIYVAADFLTITRDPGGPGWDRLRREAIQAIADHLESGEPAVTEAAPSEAAAADEIEAEIRQVLGLHVRPGVARDGGEVLFERFEQDTGVLWIRMQGACGGCPSARLTLKAGVERIVRRYVPEVMSVQEVPTEPVAGAAATRIGRWLKAAGEGAGRGVRTVFTHSGRELSSRPPNAPG